MKTPFAWLALGLTFGVPLILPAQPSPATLTVAAAANLAPVAASLTEAFAHSSPVPVQFVFGASGALVTQIQNGAPFDLFLSADQAFPQKLTSGGWTAGPPQIYATGSLILFSVQPRDFQRGLAVLADPRVSQFAMANPETAPYGKAAREALTSAGLWPTVQAKAVTAESITQAVQFATQATGLGLINKSALFSNELARYRDKVGVHWFEVDPRSYAPLRQAFVVLKASASHPGVQAFAQFLTSPEARAVFLEAGYAVP